MLKEMVFLTINIDFIDIVFTDRRRMDKEK